MANQTVEKILICEKECADKIARHTEETAAFIENEKKRLTEEYGKKLSKINAENEAVLSEVLKKNELEYSEARKKAESIKTEIQNIAEKNTESDKIIQNILFG